MSTVSSDKTGRLARLWRSPPLVAVLLVLGVLLLMFGARADQATDDGAVPTFVQEETERVEALLREVEGVGECHILLTLSAGERTVSGGGEQITYPPIVAAVTVVCEGASDDRVRAYVVEALAASYGIGRHRVTVLPLAP